MTDKKLSLYKLAKYTNLEIVMEAQVQASGANQSKLMERYKKSKKSIKTFPQSIVSVLNSSGYFKSFESIFSPF